MELKGINLSKIDEQRLVLLAEIIDAGAEEFTSKIKLSNLSIKESLLYSNFAAVNNYSEGIYILCKDLRPFPAIVILRSVVEAFINTGYFLTHNSDKRAILFVVEDGYYMCGLATEVKSFLKKNPKFETAEFNIIEFEKVLIKINDDIDNYKKRFNLKHKNKDDFKKDYHSSLLERARASDRRIRKPDFEHTYLLVYRYFSEFGHLSMRGLNHFFKADKDGNHEVIASQHDEVGHVTSMTYTMYLYFLSELKKRKMLSKNFPLKKFEKKWEEIKD